MSSQKEAMEQYQKQRRQMQREIESRGYESLPRDLLEKVAGYEGTRTFATDAWLEEILGDDFSSYLENENVACAFQYAFESARAFQLEEEVKLLRNNREALQRWLGKPYVKTAPTVMAVTASITALLVEVDSRKQR